MSGKPDSGCNALRKQNKTKKSSLGKHIYLQSHTYGIPKAGLQKCGTIVYLKKVQKQQSFNFKEGHHFLAKEIFMAFVCVILKP